MPRTPNTDGVSWFSCTRSMGLNHQVRMRLRSPVTAMQARPVTASRTASQRGRVTLWVQASRKVPVSSSRAMSGAPQKAPSRAGSTSSTGGAMICIQR
jgi:hypothetical protein